MLLSRLILITFVLGVGAQETPDSDNLEYINPLIGSTSGGNVFAGASLPYGLAKAVADVDGQNTGGFSTDGSRVTGFSALHDSGTGGNPSLGNFPLFPQVCPDSEDVNTCDFPKSARATGYINDSVVARPGYFGLTLESGIKVDMTVSERAALFRFTFPSSAGSGNASPLILLDLTDLWDSRQNASIAIDPENGRILANGTFLPSFGSGSYRSYTCVDFYGADIRDGGVWVNDRAGTETQDLYVKRGFNLFYLQAGGFLRFRRLFDEDMTVAARVGVSYISSQQACENAERGIPNPLNDFERLRTGAEGAWRERLSPISIKSGGADVELERSFWSAIYRNMLSPQDMTGENPLWESKEPYFDSFYCIWDSFRVQHPLLTIIDPETQSQMVRSLLDTYRHEGWLPDCRMSLCKGWTQGGSNADVVLADAYVKNLTGIDWGLAYEAMVNDAENEPLEWSYEGRGGLQSWKRLNYIPYLDFDYLGFGTNSRSISRTVEYSYNDFCVSTVGRGLKKDRYTTYLSRAGNWKNLFKNDQTSFINGTDTGFVGFFQPRYLNGTWGYQDPIACSALASWCSLTSNPSETFESSVWEYQFYVPHDMSSLITTLGGDDAFISRLDFFHDSGLADLGNEPVFLTVYQYHYAGRPGLSSKRVHGYIPSRFNTSTSGLPGNDDSGAMGAFTAFSMMGLFPNPGQNVYLITAPFFEEISITHPQTNQTAVIRSVNFDPAYNRIYIQSVRLNGQAYTRNWISHEFFTEGWTLELVLGEEESGWGRAVEDRPPSLSTDLGRDLIIDRGGYGEAGANILS
ncbi:Putative Glycosyl hydrolase, family 92 protein [Aspergillus calidoustus]|uniref:Putative Glycosyl hydrolase, family 92 protein n=1 Tax=Aspergillus calidoustus TaxID=454130 RepID=A0A0U5G6B9_ASPCI|nr:Putative Glycosyl hydrolase, family 92 protein [Aspergillus calidoustus]